MITENTAETGSAKGRVVLFYFAVSMFAASVMAATSDPTTVFLQPERSSFWRTATNSTVELRIDYPDGATKAELTVQGGTFAVRVPDITFGAYLVQFPEPVTPEAEDVYSLALVLDHVADAELVAEALLSRLEGDTSPIDFDVKPRFFKGDTI